MSKTSPNAIYGDVVTANTEMHTWRDALELMFDNAALLSQNRALVDDPVTRGAILRSLYVVLDRHAGGIDGASIADLLKHHPHFHS